MRNATPLATALSIATSWRLDLDLTSLIGERLDGDGAIADAGSIDVVAVGKAAGEMASATCAMLVDRVARTLVVCDDEGSASAPGRADVVVGSHPLPDERSLRAGDRLVEFLSTSTSGATIWLVSGGASSLCVQPAPPLTLDDLRAIFRASLEEGVDITTLNRLRAATSLIGGGAVLRHLRTGASLSLIMVDNVISGPRWVASGLTYEYRPPPDEVHDLVDACGLARTGLAERIMSAHGHRATELRAAGMSSHVNAVVAEPALMLASVERDARARGFEVRSLGAAVHDDVETATRRWMDVINESLAGPAPVCVVGAGEVTLNVRGRGVGGRCQHFALTMASALAGLDIDVVFVAISSDGRDFVEGVAGAWVERATLMRAGELDLDVGAALADCNSYETLARLGQLIHGRHTGWNLCDVYVALVRPASASRRDARTRTDP